MRSRSLLTLLALLATLGLFAAACGDDDDPGPDSGAEGTEQPDGPTIRVRGQDFSENVTLAEVYGQYLEAKGYDVEVLQAAGYRTEALDALESGDIDLVIDYIGGDQTALAPDTETSDDPDEVIEVIEPLLDDKGLSILQYAEAANGDALVVRGDSEAATISELDGLDYVFGGAAECYERPQCYPGFTSEDGYGITFAGTKTIEFGPLLGQSLAASEVDVVMWGTTAPEIGAEGFKVLDDDQGLFPAQNIAPIIRTEVLDAYDSLREDLDALSAAITTEDLIAWNEATDIDKRESDDVATEWLEDNGLI